MDAYARLAKMAGKRREKVTIFIKTEEISLQFFISVIHNYTSGGILNG